MEKRIAQVVFKTGAKGAFDYSIPEEFLGRVKIGQRVDVSFGNRMMKGIVVDLLRVSKFKKLKEILALSPQDPFFDGDIPELSQRIARRYFCPQGKILPLFVPQQGRLKALKEVYSEKKPFVFPDVPQAPLSAITCEILNSTSKISFFHTRFNPQKWDILKELFWARQREGKGMIFLLPRQESIPLFLSRMGLESYRSQIALIGGGQNSKATAEYWRKIASGEIKIVVGTRSAIFAPVKDLSLILMDECEDTSYKQETTPYYWAQDLAELRIEKNDARLILSSDIISVQNEWRAKRKKIGYFPLPEAPLKNISVIDLKHERIGRGKSGFIFPPILQRIVAANIHKKIVVFYNRKGFSTFVFCKKCGKKLSCAHCDTPLVYHYDTKNLVCPHCAYTKTSSEVCSSCRSSYMVYSGVGIERLESEFHRLFPNLKISVVDRQKKFYDKDAQLILGTQRIEFLLPEIQPDILIFLGVDHLINLVDYKSAERIFNRVYAMSHFAKDRVFLPTRLENHYCFKALASWDWEGFYRKEISKRKELTLPPFCILSVVYVKNRSKDKAREDAERLFASLKEEGDGLDVSSVYPAQPCRLRDKYRFCIRLKYKSWKEHALIQKAMERAKISRSICVVDVNPL